jgi:hypothetical protein
VICSYAFCSLCAALRVAVPTRGRGQARGPRNSTRQAIRLRFIPSLPIHLSYRCCKQVWFRLPGWLCDKSHERTHRKTRREGSPSHSVRWCFCSGFDVLCLIPVCFRFPTFAEQQRSADSFMERYGYPGTCSVVRCLAMSCLVVGCFDRVCLPIFVVVLMSSSVNRRFGNGRRRHPHSYYLTSRVRARLCQL